MMKDAAGEVLYIGKALSLRNRVRSYFQPSAQLGPRLRALVDRVADIEYIVTDSEIEALILESNLIKEKEPWFNVRLKDDKSFPYLKVTDERFPRVVVARRPKRGERVFGPYTDARAVRETLDVLRKVFPIRTCALDLSGRLDYRPCLLYHIGRCGAPCAGLQSEEEYNALVEEVCLFLSGRHSRLLPELRARMEEAAERLEFERAARLRDQLRALEKVIQKQKVAGSAGADQDVIGLHREGDTACAQVFFVRDGKIVGRQHYFLDAGEAEPPEIVAAFLQQYYSQNAFVPPEILLPAEPEEAEVIERWLSGLRGGRVRLRRPQRGEKRRLVEMVSDNARLVLGERLAAQARRLETDEEGLRQLQEILGLPAPPRRIEAYDISTFHGSEGVGAMVALKDGRPHPAAYRRFRIRREGEAADDYADMREVVRRRMERGLRERAELEELPPEARAVAARKARFAQMPDLIVIDGGKGQLSAARDALRDLDLEGIPTIALAEREEEVFIEDEAEPLRLPENSPALRTLQRVRDEAHRFALAYHRKLRDERTTRSALDAIPGVGPRRKRALIRHFGSVKAVGEADLDQLRAVPGMPEAVARRIYEQMRR